MNRFCLYFLAVLMLFSFFACTQSTDTSIDTPADQKTEDSSDTTSPEEPAENDDTPLTDEKEETKEEVKEKEEEAPSAGTEPEIKDLKILADNGYTYQISVTNGKACIESIRYGIYYSKDSPETHVFPSELDGYPVTEIRNLYRLRAEEVVLPESLEVFGGFYRCSTKRVHLPKNVKTVYSLSYKCALEEITVDEENPYFTAKDGVLYSKDMTTLIHFPENKSMSEYVVPETVTEISNSAFGRFIRLDRLVIGEQVTSLNASEALGGTTGFGNNDDLVFVVKKDSAAHKSIQEFLTFAEDDESLNSFLEKVTIEFM